MEEISLRIKELIDNSGLSNKEFAEKIDISPAIISHILSGRNKPSLQVIQRITNVYTNVNLNYLLTGAGALYRSKPALSDTVKQETNFNTDEAVRMVPPPSSTPLHPSAAKPETEASEAEQAPSAKKTNVNSSNKHMFNTSHKRTGKTIERVIIFYSDKSMEEYLP
jgi:transcriptional regulator with XRE-family HTH domain